MSLNEASNVDPSLLLSDATLAALNLPQQPFGPLEPNSTSFSDETTTEQIADVKQALITGDDLLLILGDAGAGKTVMLKQLGEHSGIRIQCFAVKGSERFSTMNLFAGLLDAFKHSPPEKLQDLLNDLIPYLQTMTARNTLSVIILDDAHKVKESELTQLLSAMLYINSHDETVMRIAMAAPPEFEARIPELLPEGADLPYSSLTITGMTSFRATEFVEYRMRQAGLTGEVPFSEIEINELVEKSDGLPGALQIAAVDVLNEQYGPVKRNLNDELATAGPGAAMMQSRFSKMALGAVAVFCIVLGILMSLPGKSNDDAGRYTISKTESVKFSDSKPELRLIENMSTAQNIQTDNPISAGKANVTLNGVTSTNQSSIQLLSTGTTSESVTGAETGISPLPESTTSTSSRLANSQALNTPTVTPTAISTIVESKPIVIVAAPETVESNKTLEPTLTNPAIETPVTQAPEVEAAPITQAQPQENVSTGNGQVGALESSSWILLQDRARYTVQMSASRDRDSVVNFLNMHSDALPAPNSIYTFTRNGSNWYALLHGIYESIDTARTAVEAMPAKALTNQPWIRSVARIQDVLKSQ
ncbi:MAG: DamX protein [Granulosicoccus sp.]|jgi:DamX protein